MSIEKLKKIILLKKTGFMAKNPKAIHSVSDYADNGGLFICLMI